MAKGSLKKSLSHIINVIYAEFLINEQQALAAEGQIHWDYGLIACWISVVPQSWRNPAEILINWEIMGKH